MLVIGRCNSGIVGLSDGEGGSSGSHLKVEKKQEVESETSPRWRSPGMRLDLSCSIVHENFSRGI